MSSRRILFFALLAVVGWWIFRPASPATWTGLPAPHPPQQSTANLPAPWKRGDYTFTPLAGFELQAVVLSRRNYRGGHAGELCPTDFALGWGPMSDASVLNEIKISQDMRWFFYEWRGPLPVSAAEVAASAANMHLLPANEEIRRALDNIRRHDLVHVRGYLVEAKHADGWRWHSSLSRTDAGGGACEVVWVEHVEHAAVPR